MGSGITRTVCILSSTTNWICTELPRPVCTYVAVDRRTASAYATEFVTGTFLAGEAMSTGGSTRAPDRCPAPFRSGVVGFCQRGLTPGSGGRIETESRTETPSTRNFRSQEADWVRKQHGARRVVRQGSLLEAS